ncbi:MAG: RNA-binding protein [Flaviaesturariibacter sp.]|nr:RNA-binding protein [Flaviaesturariibacter sp.]
MNIHVSNLSLNIIDSDLRRLFAAFGEVSSAVIVRNLHNGRSRGTAFIDMYHEKNGEQAILALHHSTVDGKRISVTEIEYDPTRFKN